MQFILFYIKIRNQTTTFREILFLIVNYFTSKLEIKLSTSHFTTSYTNPLLNKNISGEGAV
jgi:hypothetical protein